MPSRTSTRDAARTDSVRSSRGSGAQDAPAPRSRRLVFWQRLAVVGALLLVAGTVLAVPAQGYLAQRVELSDRESQLTDLERQNDELAARRDRLDDPAEIQRIARRDYGLVAEGEESYTILPPATAGLVLPHAWPFDRLSGALERAATAPG